MARSQGNLANIPGRVVVVVHVAARRVEENNNYHLQIMRRALKWNVTVRRVKGEEVKSYLDRYLALPSYRNVYYIIKKSTRYIICEMPVYDYIINVALLF